MQFAQTLLAVVVGAALAFASAYFLDRRHERAALAKEEKLAAMALRETARLLRGELLHAMADMEGSLHAGEWPARPAETHRWEERAGVLARGVSHGEWAAVSIAYGRVFEFNNEVDVHGYGDDLGAQDVHDINDHLQEIATAERLLLDVAGDAADIELAGA